MGQCNERMTGGTEWFSVYWAYTRRFQLERIWRTSRPCPVVGVSRDCTCAIGRRMSFVLE